MNKNGLRSFLTGLVSLAGALCMAGLSPAFGIAFPNLTYTNPYSITTLAGSAYSSGYADGTGTNALFNLPYGVVVDSSGNVYVSDQGNFVIRKITPTGSVSTLSGQAGVSGAVDGSNLSAAFGPLYGMAIDSSGFLYVCDWINASGTTGSIRKINPTTGAVSTYVPAGTLNHPTALAFDSSNNLYIADSGNNVVRKVTPTGSISLYAGVVGKNNSTDGPASSAQFGNIVGLAVDSAGDVFVLDSLYSTVREISAALVVSTIAGQGAPGEVDGAQGSSYFTHPMGIAIDSNGNLYISDGSSSGGAFVRQISAAGTVSTLAGSNQGLTGNIDGIGSSSSFNNPIGIAVDSKFNIYVTNTGSPNTLRKGTPTVSTAPSAPVITAQPASQTASTGGSATFTVTAAGSSLAYQWQFNGGSIAGATKSSYTISPVATSSAGSYSVLVSNSGGSIVSSAATLTVTVTIAPSFTTQPTSVGIASGSTATFTAAASGTPTPTYQWQFNGAALAGATNATLVIASATSANAGTYTCIATNSAGSATSSGAILTITAATAPPLFTTQPSSATVVSGSNATFSAAATGAPTPSYQWQFNGATLTGATNSTLVITGATSSNAGTYACVATNSAGSATSSSATLTVTPAPAPPTFTTQPSGLTVVSGSNATFTVAATGVPAPSYQWQFNAAPLTGATNSTLVITAVTSSNAGTYTCIATNSVGSATSSGAVLTVTTPPTFATQPSGLTVASGSNATFTVLATGAPIPTYQWQFNGGTIAGATNSTLVITSATSANAGTYTCVATNTAGSTTSTSAVLTVTTVVTPSITTQPGSQTVKAGSSVTLSVVATGTSPTYQWYLNRSAIIGATSASYSIGSATSANTGSYTVTVTNSAGSVTSSGGVLAVQSTGSPAIGIQPQSQTIATGSTVVFGVTTSGTVTLSSDEGGAARADAASNATYQWYFNGVAISGATNATLLISNVGPANAGSYSCLISNGNGSTLSNAATLSLVTTANPGRLINLSVNSALGAGQVMTLGFVIGGAGTSGSQTLLAQALGPLLSTYGVSNVMPDPQLAIVNSTQGVVASNAGWAGTSANQTAVLAADAATYASALANTTSKDSATVVSLAASPGYTVQVSSVSGAAGTTLAALYDDTPSGTYTTTVPRLINLSCKQSVTAGGVLTAGFTVGGSTSKTVLIRATGPALAAAPFNITGAMPDPTLTVYNSSQTVIASNAGWGGDPNITAADSTVYAFALNTPSSLDSALLIALPPGSYTVQDASASGSAGVTLIEVYEVP